MRTAVIVAITLALGLLFLVSLKGFIVGLGVLVVGLLIRALKQKGTSYATPPQGDRPDARRD